MTTLQASPPPRPDRIDHLARVKRTVFGRPLETSRLAHERLGKPTALAVFASDNLSSSAYASEEILRVLLTAGLGTAAFSRVVPITVALLAVLGILLFSYRQTIKAYPQAGGAYLVTRDNFGLLPAQVAGVSLLTDYILTVSVSVAAGTAALTSIYPSLHPWRVVIALSFIFLIAMGNLRGVKEAGRVFSVPTYFFILMMATLIGTSFFRIATGTVPHHVATFPVPHSENITGFALVFLLLRAFASGGAAVTGVEAISNGVPAFKPPEWRNAITTLMWMGTLLGGMFLGLSIIAARLRITVDPSERVTVLAQVGKAVFGTSHLGTALFVMLQIATMLILVLAANTSFADFPRLASFLAGDAFLPRQLMRYGDRLVFSNGIIVLSAFASLLVVAFRASVTRLIPLYAIGVFASFTFSQLGMAKHHITKKEPGWRPGLVINGFGGCVSGIMTIIIAVTKFSQGAWIILIAIPIMLSGLLKVNKHYKTVGATLRDPARKPTGDTPRQVVVIAATDREHNYFYPAAYAARVFPTEVRVVHVSRNGEDPWAMLERWSHLGDVAEVRSARHALPDDLRDYVREVREEVGPGGLINVIVPESVAEARARHLLRSRKLQMIKAALLTEGKVVVTSLTMHEGYEQLVPGTEEQSIRAVLDEWRHVVIPLVSSVHNATLAGLRYARSLRADELQCLHVEVDAHEGEQIREQWEQWKPGAPLEILESPFREITTPVHRRVRAILDERPKTFVTIVIPEFLLQKGWHQLMHNQTPLMLKTAFLFEPSVVVASVPYQL